MSNKNGNVASKQRMSKLESGLVKTVQTVLKKTDGDFTVNEIVSVMSKLAYQFNSRGLDYQWLEADGQPEGNDNVHQLNPTGKA